VSGARQHGHHHRIRSHSDHSCPYAETNRKAPAPGASGQDRMCQAGHRRSWKEIGGASHGPDSSPPMPSSHPIAGTGYLERMARRRLPDSAQVPIGLKVSEADAARIDEVLMRPEFAGWTRSEWCREIIRTALRYYVGGAPAPDPGQARASVRPAPAQPVPPSQPPAPPAASARIPAVGTSSPADEPAAEPAARGAGAAGPVPPSASEPRPGRRDEPEPAAQPECPHPAEARDWQTGTCAACGAVLWD
jgi:hypothetical protein